MVRHQQQHGSEPEAGEREANAPPPGWIATDPFAAYLIKKMELDERRAAAVPTKPRFDWTINTGNVIVLLTILAASVAAYGGWTQSVAVMNAAIQQNQRDIQANFEGDRLRTGQYAPRIDTMEKLVATMAGRLDNQGDSMIELRKSMTELVRVSSEMHESLAIMKMQQDRDRNAAPHG